jgi:SNF2 family DNA or RNA helicase
MLDRRDFKAIVLDEMHYVKNYKAKRTEAIKHLAKRRGIRLGLTGTPVLNRPQELISPLGILGRLDDMGGFWHFARHFCNAYKTSYGWDMSGAAHLEELNQRLRATCFVRRRKSEVLTELPAKQRAIVPVDITNRKEYEAAEADVISYCAGRAMKQEAFLKSLRGQPPEVQARMKREHYEDAAERAEQAEQLVRIEALKQVAAKGKAEAVQEWVESFLESGEKLVLFAHHRDFQRSLCALFPGCARLAGDDDSATRQANVDRFQTDPDCRLIVCSLVAGGVGITLTAASNVAFVEFGWNPAAHDQAEDRTHRIGQRDQVTAWYLAADRTIDTDILDLVEKKRAVVDAATDGQAGGRDTGILNELVERLTQKGGRRGE